MAILALLIGAIAALYATAGQAGGTGFLAVMSLASFPSDEMRATTLGLNIVAAGYATFRLHRAKAVDWPLLRVVAASSVLAAFVGGLIVIKGQFYSGVTGSLLLVAAILMVFRVPAKNPDPTGVRNGPALLAGTATGFASGLTGVGGGVFLAPLLIFFGWASPKRAAAISAPFILINSAAAFIAILLTGGRVPTGFAALAMAALVGSAIGTAISIRWMSQAAVRYVLATILLVASIQLLIRSF